MVWMIKDGSPNQAVMMVKREEQRAKKYAGSSSSYAPSAN